MKFCRINLAETNYHPVDNFKIIDNPNFEQLNKIYYDYCNYHKFKSVQPIFPEDLENTIFGYYHNQELVAFTICIEYEQSKIIHNDQFAWNYHHPKLTLGMCSIRNECAYYKARGYKYMFLQHFDEYKTNFQGFELCGPAELNKLD